MVVIIFKEKYIIVIRFSEARLSSIKRPNRGAKVLMVVAEGEVGEVIHALYNEQDELHRHYDTSSLI